MQTIYFPEEDSYLLAQVLEKEIPKFLRNNPNLKTLEIGVGSGIQLQILENTGVKRKNIFSCDINLESIRHCKDLGFNCVRSDLFTNIKRKFDVIIFNPPYLPEDKREPNESRLATTGGKIGSKLINEFLSQAKNYLGNNGQIFLLTSSLTKKIIWKNWKKEKIAEKKLFFEKLYVWKLRI